MDLSNRALFFVAALTVLPSFVWAADNELYDDPPPDDAAFVRWIEDAAAPRILGVSMPGEHGKAFHPVSAALTNDAKAGSYYTAAIDALGEIAIIEEPARQDRSKVLLTLLNISEGAVRLLLTGQNAEVIGSTAVNDASARPVNPVATTLSVVTSSGAVLGVFDVQLRRGQNITFVARPEGAELIENRFGPNIEG